MPIRDTGNKPTYSGLSPQWEYLCLRGASLTDCECVVPEGYIYPVSQTMDVRKDRERPNTNSHSKISPCACHLPYLLQPIARLIWKAGLEGTIFKDNRLIVAMSSYRGTVYQVIADIALVFLPCYSYGSLTNDFVAAISPVMIIPERTFGRLGYSVTNHGRRPRRAVMVCTPGAPLPIFYISPVIL